MFVIPILEGPTDVLCDNQSAVKNTSKFESTLDKKQMWHYLEGLVVIV